jgi:hypothetical protein
MVLPSKPSAQISKNGVLNLKSILGKGMVGAIASMNQTPQHVRMANGKTTTIKSLKVGSGKINLARKEQ